MEFRLLHRDLPSPSDSAGPRPEAACCMKVSAAQERPERVRLSVTQTSSVLPGTTKTHVLADFTFEAAAWLPASGDTLANTAHSKVLEEEVLEQLDENLPITMEYSSGGKTVKTPTQYKLGQFLDDNPRLLDAARRRAKPLTAMYCLVRARFMQFPSALSLVVRRPRRLFRRVLKTKTVVKFSFDIDKWEKVPRSIHTFENTSPNEYVNYRHLLRLDPSLPLTIRTTVGGKVTDTETDLLLSDLLSYLLQHRRGPGEQPAQQTPSCQTLKEPQGQRTHTRKAFILGSNRPPLLSRLLQRRRGHSEHPAQQTSPLQTEEKTRVMGTPTPDTSTLVTSLAPTQKAE